MKDLILNKYTTIYLVIYIVTLIFLNVRENIAIGEVIFLLIIFGIIFTTVATITSRSAIPLFTEKPAQKNETQVLLILVIGFVLFLTFYKDIIQFVNPNVESGSLVYKLITGALKLMFIVMLPMLVYKLFYGFELKYWGIAREVRSYFSKNSIIIFVTFLIMITLLQFFISNGFKPVREGSYTSKQLLVGIPLNFIWLLLTVGIVEEFFFRSFLQSRLAILLKSQVGGIIISTTIFGLAHAPGIYLRSGGVIANLGSDPSLLLSLGYSFVALSIAGIFLSIIWLKTKNFWLIASIHASVDLLPSLSDFIDTWSI